MAAPPGRALLARLDAPLAARLCTARDWAAATRPPTAPAWSAAVPDLARVLPGGLPSGALTELAGRRSSGRLGVVLALLAAATGAGESAALIDLGDALDPEQAAAAGVVLERLLWVRPRRLGETLAAAEAVLAGGFPLVAVDLGLPPVPGGRGSDAQWLRLAHAARAGDTALVVATPSRRCGVAATTALTVELARPRWQRAAPGAPPLLAGLDLRLTLARAAHAGTPAGVPQARFRLAAS